MHSLIFDLGRVETDQITMARMKKLFTFVGRVCGQVVAVFLLAAVLCASALTSAAGTNVPPLNEDQRRIEEWTTRQFRSFFDNRTFAGWSQTELEALEKKSIDMLKGPHSREYFQAINTLGAMHSTNGFKPLLAIATDRADKDNRDRWMAIRALGLVGDKSIVPELIPLVYHGSRQCEHALVGADFPGAAHGHEFRRRLARVGRMVESQWREAGIRDKRVRALGATARMGNAGASGGEDSGKRRQFLREAAAGEQARSRRAVAGI
jgi:hypothetical protein